MHVARIAVVVNARLGMGQAVVGTRVGAQRLVLDVDQPDRLGGRGLVAGDDGGHRVADEADLVRTEGVLVVADGQDAVGDREAVAGEDQVHAGMCRRACRVDPGDARVRHRGAEQLAVQHPREHDVIGEPRLPSHLRPPVDAPACLADHGAHRVSSPRSRASFARSPALAKVGARTPRPQLLGGLLHRLDDLQIARAPAQVARERFTDLRGRRVRLAIQQGLRGDQDPRRAVPALRCAEVGKRVLQRVQRAVLRQALDGGHGAPAALEAENEAREHRLAVQQDGTGAAFAELAAMLGPRELQVLAQHLEERLVAVYQFVRRLAVDGSVSRTLPPPRSSIRS